MKIGAYQFAVTGNIKNNLDVIKRAICQAADESVKLLAFPECALTGYPPRDIEAAYSVDFAELASAQEQIQRLAIDNDMHIVIGTITKDEEIYHNSAIVFAPDKPLGIYHKRALWGWDKDNFSAGNHNGVF